MPNAATWHCLALAATATGRPLDLSMAAAENISPRAGAGVEVCNEGLVG
jgi:hypothetical protein